MIRVHTTLKVVHEYPDATRFLTEDEFNNLCIFEQDKLIALFSDGHWVAAERVEFADG